MGGWVGWSHSDYKANLSSNWNLTGTGQLELSLAKYAGACQLPGDAKCFSVSTPVGFTGNACCSGYKCLPWVEAGSTQVGSEDWYCQQPRPLTENSLCVSFVGSNA